MRKAVSGDLAPIKQVFLSNANVANAANANAAQLSKLSKQSKLS
jgi:hypothetical protein